MNKELYRKIPFSITSAHPIPLNLETARKHIEKTYPSWKKKYGYLYKETKDSVLKTAFVYRYFDDIFEKNTAQSNEDRGKRKQKFMAFILSNHTGQISKSHKPTKKEIKQAKNREYSMIHAVGGKEYWDKILFD